MNVVGFDPLKNLHFGFTVGGKMGCEVSPLLFAASEPRLAHAQNRNRDGVFVSVQSAVITGVCQMIGCCQIAARPYAMLPAPNEFRRLGAMQKGPHVEVPNGEASC